MTSQITEQLRSEVKNGLKKKLIPKQDLIRLVISEVENYYGYMIDTSNRRKENIEPVHLIYYLIRNCFGQYKITLIDLSRIFLKGTANILIACKSMENRMETEPSFNLKMWEIKRNIQESVHRRTNLIRTEFLTFNINLN